MKVSWDASQGLKTGQELLGWVSLFGVIIYDSRP